MKMLNSRRTQSFLLLFCAAGLAACSFLGPPTAAPQVPPQPATPTETGKPPTATSTLDGPTPTPLPTVTPTPLPLQPIGFANADDLQIVREIEVYGQRVEIISRAVSPDTRLAAIAGCQIEDDDQCHVKTYFRLFDVNTGEVLLDLEHLSPAVQVLAFSPDGTVLAAAGCDISLYIYGEFQTICDLPRAWLVSTETGKIIAELKGYTSHVLDFAFSPDGATLYTSVRYDRYAGDGDHVIRAYDAHTGEKLSTTETGMITCTDMYLDISPDGRYLVADVTVTDASCGLSFVAWWDIQDPAHLRLVTKADSFGRSRVSPDSTQVLLNNLKDKTLKLYDLVSGNSIKLIPNVPRQTSLRTYDYLNDSNTVILDVTNEYNVIDLTSGEVVQRIAAPDGQHTGFYLLTPDRSTLFVFGYLDSLAVDVWDLSSWQSYPLQLDRDNVWIWPGSFSSDFLVFSPDRTRLLVFDCDYGNIQAQLWGFPDPSQEQASQVLRQYLDLLASGDYQEAAQMYIPFAGVSAEVGPNVYTYPGYTPEYLESLLPEVDITDAVALLTLLCQDPAYPCMPLRDMLFQSQIWDHLYRFTVTFTGPDGEQAAWPLCRNVPAANWCEYRGGEFPFYVLQRPDGGFNVVDGLPPAVNLRMDN